jgi:hypothetical protein
MRDPRPKGQRRRLQHPRTAAVSSGPVPAPSSSSLVCHSSYSHCKNVDKQSGSSTGAATADVAVKKERRDEERDGSPVTSAGTTKQDEPPRLAASHNQPRCQDPDWMDR